MGFLLVILGFFTLFMVGMAFLAYWAFIILGFILVVVLMVIYGASFYLAMLVTGNEDVAFIIGCIAAVTVCFLFFKKIMTDAKKK